MGLAFKADGCLTAGDGATGAVGEVILAAVAAACSCMDEDSSMISESPPPALPIPRMRPLAGANGEAGLGASAVIVAAVGLEVDGVAIADDAEGLAGVRTGLTASACCSISSTSIGAMSSDT